MRKVYQVLTREKLEIYLNSLLYDPAPFNRLDFHRFHVSGLRSSKGGTFGAERRLISPTVAGNRT